MKTDNSSCIINSSYYDRETLVNDNTGRKLYYQRKLCSNIRTKLT